MIIRIFLSLLIILSSSRDLRAEKLVEESSGLVIGDSDKPQNAEVSLPSDRSARSKTQRGTMTQTTPVLLTEFSASTLEKIKQVAPPYCDYLVFNGPTSFEGKAIAESLRTDLRNIYRQGYRVGNTEVEDMQKVAAKTWISIVSSLSASDGKLEHVPFDHFAYSSSDETSAAIVLANHLRPADLLPTFLHELAHLFLVHESKSSPKTVLKAFADEFRPLDIGGRFQSTNKIADSTARSYGKVNEERLTPVGPIQVVHYLLDNPHLFFELPAPQANEGALVPKWNCEIYDYSNTNFKSLCDNAHKASQSLVALESISRELSDTKKFKNTSGILVCAKRNDLGALARQDQVGVIAKEKLCEELKPHFRYVDCQQNNYEALPGLLVKYLEKQGLWNKEFQWRPQTVNTGGRKERGGTNQQDKSDKGRRGR